MAARSPAKAGRHVRRQRNEFDGDEREIRRAEALRHDDRTVRLKPDATYF
jgi:hypothetical protein